MLEDTLCCWELGGWTDWSRCGHSVSQETSDAKRVLLGGGGALQAAVGRQGPVFPSSSAKCTLPVLTADLHLEHLLVALLVLVGRQVHACIKRRVKPTWKVHGGGGRVKRMTGNTLPVVRIRHSISSSDQGLSPPVCQEADRPWWTSKDQDRVSGHKECNFTKRLHILPK